MKRTVLCVFGTRPDAVKMAPVVHALQRRPEHFETRVAVTGQHREQLDQVLRVFDITPDCNLAIMRHGQTLSQITSRALEGLATAVTQLQPHIILAQGDTTTTFAAALSAFYHGVPFGHVEAGLRTENILNPFPEEMNRRLTAPITRWHFAPTERARQNLLAERISENRVWVTGNTGIDALLTVAGSDNALIPQSVADSLLPTERLILVTAHRRENWGEPLADICRALVAVTERFADVRVVFALHRNPTVRDTVRPILENRDRISLIDPPDYAPFVKLMQRSEIILTDSGGVQEEAPSLGVPVLVLRTTTERPEGVTAGAAKLVGTSTEDILREATLLLLDPLERKAMSARINPYGDGKAANRICELLIEHGESTL